jgi:hypothetical protein
MSGIQINRVKVPLYIGFAFEVEKKAIFRAACGQFHQYFVRSFSRTKVSRAVLFVLTF